MRKLLAGTAAAALALLLLAPAHAADSVPPELEGSRNTTPLASETASPTITALIHRKNNVIGERIDAKTWFTTPAGLPAGCPAPGEVEVTNKATDSGEKNTALITAFGSAPCNGTYGVRIQATLVRVGSDPVATFTSTVNVLVPPANLTGVSGVAEGANAVLSWPAVSPKPLDLIGYRILRYDGEDPTTIAEVGPEQLSFTDTPPLGGRVTYQVLALRSGPGTKVPSAGGGKVTVELPVVTTTSTTPPGTDGGTDSGATDGGATAGADGGATAGTDSGVTTTTAKGGGTVVTPPKNGGGRSFAPLPRGQVGVGTKAPRLGVPSQSNVDALLNDDGYDEELDYGGLADGGGEDGLSSVDYEEEGQQRGMAVPVATGFVLGAWAFHLRYLAKAAKPLAAATPAAGAKRKPARGAHRR